jgi:hypothetical protein
VLSSILLALSLQVGPFFEARENFHALRPVYAVQDETLDVLWPVFSKHDSWWRFLVLAHYREGDDGSYQFSLSPIWFNGMSGTGQGYCGLFPIAGYHPHIGMMWDLKFGLWPIWTQYKNPRPSENKWMETNSVLFPFFSYRDDGSWSVWPFYGVNHRRESDHRYVLWPLVNWALYRADRDTAGSGYSWMVMPFWGRVKREREDQTFILPPFISYAKMANGAFRLRAPWPLFEKENNKSRERFSVWPFYERTVDYGFKTSEKRSEVTRLGWKLVELYDDETRVFPFWVSSKNYFRLWPLYDSSTENGVECSRVLSLFPIRHVPQIERSWSKFWTFYERRKCVHGVEHALFWGIFNWRSPK